MIQKEPEGGLGAGPGLAGEITSFSWTGNSSFSPAGLKEEAGEKEKL